MPIHLPRGIRQNPPRAIGSEGRGGGHQERTGLCIGGGGGASDHRRRRRRRVAYRRKEGT